MLEMCAEPLREPRIEFDKGEAANRAACDALAQDAEAGANLDHVVAGSEFGGGDDTVGDTGLDEEILPFRFERTYACVCERRGGAERADNRWRCFVAHRLQWEVGGGVDGERVGFAPQKTVTAGERDHRGVVGAILERRR